MAINTKKFAGVVRTTLAEKYDTTATKKDCEKFVNAVLDSIADCLADGESVKFTGFGSFEVHERKERTCVNPRTKEKMLVPESKSPAFKAGKSLKDAVKGES